MRKFEYLKVFNSPFKRPKLKWYIGKVAIGTPYFFPRVVDKKTNRFKPKKIGFDFVRLGYKTKWSPTDYRFEWAPLISFVFFKWQIAVSLLAPFDGIKSSLYWEAWLYYHYNTKGTQRERIEQCKKDFPSGYSGFNGSKKYSVNSYDYILKDKYK
jgi:hypothetical protein